MRVYAPAKVNLALDVVGQMPNGYHELDMVMAPISLYNVLDISPSDHSSICCLNGKIPNDNAMKKMMKLLKSQFPQLSNYTILIDEHIPMQAGLAGASANAAAVLRALNELNQLHLSTQEMIDLGKQVGADVPFCIVNQLARVKGIGEKIQTFSRGWKSQCLLVKPDIGVSTPEAFQKWHELDPIHPCIEDVQKAIEQKDTKKLYDSMANALEPAAISMIPLLADIKQEMEDLGCEKVLMSGSGSTMMGFGNIENLKNAKAQLKDTYYFVDIVTIGGDAWPIQS